MKKTLRKNLTPSQMILNAVMLCIMLVMLVPILNLLAKSLSSPEFVSSMKGYEILPRGFNLIHYQVIFQNEVIWRALLNSVFITVTGVAINILLTTSMAYALTRKHLLGKKAIMVFLIIMMIFEPGIIQEYFVMKDIHLLDNIWSMVLYRSVSVYNVVLLMRFFEDTPDALMEAATLDGAGHLRAFFYVFLPLNKIPIMTVGMFYAVYRWNEFFHSSIFLSSRKNTVLQVFLRQFVVEGDTTALAALGTLDLTSISVAALRCATIVITIVPILVVYPFILKHYASGVMTGGVKE